MGRSLNFATRSIERFIGHVCPQCRSGERGVRKIAKKKKMLKGQKWLAYSIARCSTK